MFWVGSKDQIEALEATATEVVCSRPETIDGVAVPPIDRVTERWAAIQQTADGRYFIPALDAMPSPEGVELVEGWPGTPPAVILTM